MARKATDIIADLKAGKAVSPTELQILNKTTTGRYYIDFAEKNGLVQAEQQAFAGWFQGGQATNPQRLNPPDEKSIPKIVNNLNIQRPYPETTASPLFTQPAAKNPQANSASLDGTNDPDKGKIPNVGGEFDQNADGRADYNDMAVPGVNNNGEETLTFTMAQLQNMLAGFTQNLINPNSNIMGAPQTEWNTQNSQDQQAAVAQAQQMDKDRALAALAAMKNS